MVKEENVLCMKIIGLPGIGMIAAGDDLVAIILGALRGYELELQAGDVLVIAQKIVSKSEGRAVALDTVTPSPRAQSLADEVGKDARVVELILSESREVLRSRPGILIVEDRRGLVLANAGIDASNVSSLDGRETVLLLPEDPDRSAAALAQGLSAACGRTIGVIINDSIGRAWRNGTVGTAIGVAGVPALADLRGQPDLFARALQSTTVGFADELAAAASMVMGQAAEGRPVVVIRGANSACAAGCAQDLLRPRDMDLFR